MATAIAERLRAVSTLDSQFRLLINALAEKQKESVQIEARRLILLTAFRKNNYSWITNVVRQFLDSAPNDKLHIYTEPAVDLCTLCGSRAITLTIFEVKFPNRLSVNGRY
jgi:hypothetical protein